MHTLAPAYWLSIELSESLQGHGQKTLELALQPLKFPTVNVQNSCINGFFKRFLFFSKSSSIFFNVNTSLKSNVTIHPTN